MWWFLWELAGWQPSFPYFGEEGRRKEEGLAVVAAVFPLWVGGEVAGKWITHRLRAESSPLSFRFYSKEVERWGDRRFLRIPISLWYGVFCTLFGTFPFILCGKKGIFLIRENVAAARAYTQIWLRRGIGGWRRKTGGSDGRSYLWCKRWKWNGKDSFTYGIFNFLEKRATKDLNPIGIGISNLLSISNLLTY